MDEKSPKIDQINPKHFGQKQYLKVPKYHHIGRREKTQGFANRSYPIAKKSELEFQNPRRMANELRPLNL